MIEEHSFRKSFVNYFKFKKILQSLAIRSAIIVFLLCAAITANFLFEQFSNNLESNKIGVAFKKDVSKDNIETLYKTIAANAILKQSYLISPEAALSSLCEKYGQLNSNIIPHNPLPYGAEFSINPMKFNPEKYDFFIRQLESYSEIDEILIDKSFYLECKNKYYASLALSFVLVGLGIYFTGFSLCKNQRCFAINNAAKQNSSIISKWAGLTLLEILSLIIVLSLISGLVYFTISLNYFAPDFSKYYVAAVPCGIYFALALLSSLINSFVKAEEIIKEEAPKIKIEKNETKKLSGLFIP